jgi:hypothetical protein
MKTPAGHTRFAEPTESPKALFVPALKATQLRADLTD